MSNQQFVSRFVRAGAYKMHYVEWGDGMPVVMVHGGGPGAAGEFGWGNNVGTLGRHGRAIAVDQIGFGLSDKPLDKEFSHQFMAEQLAVFIDTLCLDEVYVTGNSAPTWLPATRWITPAGSRSCCWSAAAPSPPAWASRWA